MGLSRRTLVTTDWLQAHWASRPPRGGRAGLRDHPAAGAGVEEATYRGAAEEYLAGHIPGAVFIDWTKTLSDPDDPVPVQVAPPDRFADAMSGRGIGDATHVVAADHLGGQFATRLWWALRYYGHERVGVLDGGWNRWVEEGGRRGGTGSAARPSFTRAPSPG